MAYKFQDFIKIEESFNVFLSDFSIDSNFDEERKKQLLLLLSTVVLTSATCFTYESEMVKENILSGSSRQGPDFGDDESILTDFEDLIRSLNPKTLAVYFWKRNKTKQLVKKESEISKELISYKRKAFEVHKSNSGEGTTKKEKLEKELEEVRNQVKSLEGKEGEQYTDKRRILFDKRSQLLDQIEKAAEDLSPEAKEKAEVEIERYETLYSDAEQRQDEAKDATDKYIGSNDWLERLVSKERDEYTLAFKKDLRELTTGKALYDLDNQIKSLEVSIKKKQDHLDNLVKKGKEKISPEELKAAEEELRKEQDEKRSEKSSEEDTEFEESPEEDSDLTSGIMKKVDVTKKKSEEKKETLKQGGGQRSSDTSRESKDSTSDKKDSGEEAKKPSAIEGQLIDAKKELEKLKDNYETLLNDKHQKVWAQVLKPQIESKEKEIAELTIQVEEERKKDKTTTWDTSSRG